MNENTTFVFQDVEVQERAMIVYAYPSYKRSRASLIVEGEPSKTEQDVRLIQLAQDWINEQRVALGLQPNFGLPIDEVHFLPNDIFLAQHDNSETFGYHNALTDAVYINADKCTGFGRLDTLLHELIHRMARKQITFNGTNKGSFVTWTGYSYQDSVTKENRLFGFNEAVTDGYKFDIYQSKSQEEVHAALENIGMKISLEEIRTTTSYRHYMYALEAVLNKLARGLDRPALDIWCDLKTALGLSYNPYLHVLDSIAGPNSLVILTQMGNEPKALLDEIGPLFAEFFITDDQNRRDKIQSVIFSAVNYQGDNFAWLNI